MATPMTADQFLAALQAEGLHIVGPAGWRDHNRAGHGGWGPMNGVMIHHTGGTAPSDGALVWAGRSDLPGPLAHGYLDKTGVVTMTANGRANHAGGGDPSVLAAVVAEAATVPPTHYHDGSSGAVDGNAHFYGLEISNLGDGKDPYPAAQYDAAVRWAAAICRFHGWSAHSVIGHKEWSDWKSDPSFSMNTFRAAVAARLAAPAGASTTEDDVPLTTADADTILNVKLDDPTTTDDSQVSLRAVLWSAGANAFQANNAVKAARGDIAALAAKVDKISTGGVDLDALAAKVADLLAKRLES
jgi:hypothetical protein